MVLVWKYLSSFLYTICLSPQTLIQNIRNHVALLPTRILTQAFAISRRPFQSITNTEHKNISEEWELNTGKSWKKNHNGKKSLAKEQKMTNNWLASEITKIQKSVLANRTMDIRDPKNKVALLLLCSSHEFSAHKWTLEYCFRKF